MFNFGSLANISEASSVKYLKPYNIYNDVEVESTEVKEGTSASGNNWKMLKINFKSPEGVYSESIFYPKEGDDVRREIDMPNGGKRYVCSNFEVAMAMVAAIGRAFNPKGFEKMQEMSSKFRSFDDVVTCLCKILDASKGTKTSMKLVGRNSKDNKTYAKLPQPIGIMQDNATKEWITFPVAIFGKNLSFSKYEEEKREKYYAKPTEMPEAKSDPLSIDTSNISDLPFDLDNLEI